MFEHNDITHIIIEKEEEIPAIVDCLKNRFSSIGEEALTILFTKIYCNERLSKDI